MSPFSTVMSSGVQASFAINRSLDSPIAGSSLITGSPTTSIAGSSLISGSPTTYRTASRHGGETGGVVGAGATTGPIMDTATQSVQQAQDAPPQPQVVVIRSDGNGRMTTAEAAPDYGYVQGCHAIPNGYHCDPATQAR